MAGKRYTVISDPRGLMADLRKVTTGDTVGLRDAVHDAARRNTFKGLVAPIEGLLDVLAQALWPLVQEGLRRQYADGWTMQYSAATWSDSEP